MAWLYPLLAGVVVLLATASGVQAQSNIVTSVKPIHSLVAGVMAGIGTPRLIVDGAGSPHTHSLRPTQARDIQNADVVFWVGHALEPFLEKPLTSLVKTAHVVELLETPGLTHFSVRSGGAFDDHEHGNAGGHDDDHDEDGINPHIWLDPDNAQKMVETIGRTLMQADPANAARYAINTGSLMRRLDALTRELETVLAPARGKPFVVFHDAYRYMEARFGLNAVGAIMVHPEVVPGVRQISEIQARVRALKVGCVFTEPQFTPKLVAVVREGTKANTAVLDPLGAGFKAGPDLYFEMMRAMALTMRDCLGSGN